MFLCEGISPLRSLWIFRRALKILIISPISPLRILYNHPFYIYLQYKPHIPPAHNLNPLSWGLWGVVILNYIIPERFNYIEKKMAISKFLLDEVGKEVGVEGVFVAFQSLWLWKRALGPSISNLMSLWSFYYSSLDKKCHSLNKTKINNTFYPHRSSLSKCYWNTY